jgi:hypothetical protein
MVHHPNGGNPNLIVHAMSVFCRWGHPQSKKNKRTGPFDLEPLDDKTALSTATGFPIETKEAENRGWGKSWEMFHCHFYPENAIPSRSARANFTPKPPKLGFTLSYASQSVCVQPMGGFFG